MRLCSNTYPPHYKDIFVIFKFLSKLVLQKKVSGLVAAMMLEEQVFREKINKGSWLVASCVIHISKTDQEFSGNDPFSGIPVFKFGEHNVLLYYF